MTIKAQIGQSNIEERPETINLGTTHDPVTVYWIGRCTGCGGWNGVHTTEGFGMWHEHDGKRCEFEPVPLIELEAAHLAISEFAES